MHKLVRHLREIHVNKQQPKYVLPENRSRNFVPSTRNPHSYANSSIFDQRTTSLNTNLIIQQPCQSQINQIQMFPSPGCYSDGLTTSINQVNAISNNLSPNYISTNYSTQPYQQPIIQQVTQQQAQPSQPPKPVEHLFVQPSRPNRLLYTDTYIKYIERLKPEHKHVSNWETQLNATPHSSLNYDRNKLPSSWLKNGEGNHGSVVNALWNLRNFMLEDSLKLNRLNS